MRLERELGEGLYGSHKESALIQFHEDALESSRAPDEEISVSKEVDIRPNALSFNEDPSSQV